MKWVWEQNKWPNFTFDSSKLVEWELLYQKAAGRLIGNTAHINIEDILQMKIDVYTQEAISTSNIEGEILERDSVQSSIRRHLGLKESRRKVKANEAGIAELMVDIYSSYDKPLSHETMHKWHEMISNGRRDLEAIGRYRVHEDPMQIVSGNLTNTKILYVAPPSKRVQKEMEQFVHWYNEHAAEKSKLPTLVFAGLTHLYFEVIHPYEDGNGRIGRALVEKALSQRAGEPSLNSFSKMIEMNKKKYYSSLQKCNTALDATEWLVFFSEMVLNAQNYTIEMVQFLIAKTKFFYKYKSTLNERQEKVVLRMFEEGIEGFKGGLSAENYISITSTSPATATRDLQELVQWGAFIKRGAFKHSRYAINLNSL
ncbi:MAG: Fic family protein [Chitinophagales bacterium]|nr:Fic family protein [Chitinophagales bacterium]